jgi:acetyltransferase-like isoleucine patch superfamily enzyme
MGPHSRLGHLTIIRGLCQVKLGAHATIGNLNWITGYPREGRGYFVDEKGRKPDLYVGEHAAITNRHLIDCTNEVRIGRFSTLAGWRSQVLTHSIDLRRCRQASAPIEIGDYCFVGTGCVILGGGRLPGYCVLGAGAVLREAYSTQWTIYAGVPAKAIGVVAREWKYFVRPSGYVL